MTNLLLILLLLVGCSEEESLVNSIVGCENDAEYSEFGYYCNDVKFIEDLIALNSSLENMGIDEKANYDISPLLPSGKNYKHLTRAKKLLEKRMEPFKYQNDKANKRREDLNKNLGTDYSSLDNDLFLSEGFQDIIKDSIRQRLTGAMTPEQEQRLSYLTFSDNLD